MIQHADNWYAYGGNAALPTNGTWADFSAHFTADPDGTSPGFVASLGGADDMRIVYPATVTTAGMANRVWMAALPASGSGPSVVQFADASNVLICRITITTTGRIRAYNAAGTQIGESAAPAVTANAWWHIETKAVISTTVGSLEVRVEGTTVLALTNLNLGSLPIAQLSVAQGFAPTYYVKDFVQWDGTGTHNTDFLGSVVVTTQLTTSDVSFNWVSTGANGYSVLDNSPPLDTTQYISAAYPPPAASTFGLSSLPSNITSVKAVMTTVRAKKVDGGDGNLQVSVVSGASTGAGANRPITAAFTYWRDVFEVDPATSANWTIPAVNALNLKVNRTV